MIYVIYHSPCYDGHGAAWAAKRYFDIKKPEVEYIPMNYGDPIPVLEPGSDIIMVDFSFKRDVMNILAKEAHSLIVLDHHKSAEEDLKGFPHAIFDMKKSGAVLSWEYFFPEKPVPSILLYVQDADLWEWKLPKTKEINTWIRSYPRDFDVWDRMAQEMGQVSIVEGAAILRFQNQKVEEIAANATLVEWEPYGKIPAVNTCCFMSEVANLLLEQHPESKFSCYWMDRSDGKRQWGLRCRDGFDVSEVAKKLGGGGHQKAAGFVTETGQIPEEVE